MLALSLAVTVICPSPISNRKQSNMDREFLELITLASVPSLLAKVEDDNVNLISLIIIMYDVLVVV
jgi:hypothetical protein